MNINEMYEKLRLAGVDWSDKDAAASLLEETKKSVLSELMALAQEGTSMAAREAAALAHTQYKQHVKAMVDARKAANRARVEYDARKVWCELMRTEAATRRAEMGLK